MTELFSAQQLPNHEAMNEIAPLIDELRDSNELSGNVEFLAAKDRVENAEDALDRIAESVGADGLDEAVAEYVDHSEAERQQHPDELKKAVAVAVEEVFVHPELARLTTIELRTVPIEELGEVLKDVETVKGEAAVEDVIEAIEAADTESSGIPEFDRLDDYSPEFKGQMLLHRSNADLKPGDMVLPSDQISAEMHEELNSKRAFSSSSAPQGSGGYDKQLAHAGVRDFGKQYGDYLYVVEPIEDDTLKWGENFGAGVSRGRKFTSKALAIGGDDFDTTDSRTGKLHHEVVSTKGFRVVERIAHEPDYEEAMLPWPTVRSAIDKHQARRKNAMVGVLKDDGTMLTEKIRTTSRLKGVHIGPRNSPGSFRADANKQLPVDMQNKFDLRKQQAENPRQIALPGMPISKFRKKHEVPTMSEPYFEPRDQIDTMFPEMEVISPRRPML